MKRKGRNDMKKTVSFMIAAAIILSAVLLSAPVVASSTRGDVNGDESTDNKDVVWLFRYVSSNEELSAEYDQNGDGKVDNKDVTVLFRQVSGFTPGETSEIPAQKKTRLLNKVAYNEKGDNTYFDDPEFLSKLSSFANKVFTMSKEGREGNYTASPLSAYMALAVLNAIGDDGVRSDIETLFGMDQTDI